MSDFSAGYTETPRKKHRIARYRWAVIVIITLAAILFRVYVPRFIGYLSYLELPLLVTIYFSLMQRSPITGVLLGSSIGLAEDSLYNNLLGMFGIAKTLVGYLVATATQWFDIETPATRFLLTFSFFWFHQFAYWTLGRALLGQPLRLEVPQTMILAVLNALVAVPLFHILDKLRVSD